MVSEGSDYINDWHSVIISYIDTIDSRNFGQTFEGKKSKDLVSRRVQILSYDTLTTTYGYQFDSQGRVSEQIENPGPAQTTVYYTYY
ncbi:MAG: hypothetical protein JWO06_1262 [Bacteroidota bacterium]|nr:hypothetical protein [Bacteroidota bacterium]